MTQHVVSTISKMRHRLWILPDLPATQSISKNPSSVTPTLRTGRSNPFHGSYGIIDRGQRCWSTMRIVIVKVVYGLLLSQLQIVSPNGKRAQTNGRTLAMSAV